MLPVTQKNGERSLLADLSTEAPNNASVLKRQRPQRLSKATNVCTQIQSPTASFEVRVPRKGSPSPIKPLPKILTSKITGLNKRSLSLLQSKQRRLRSSPLEDTVTAGTLVFAQEEAGTAVCISKQGMLLTCSHCVVEDPSEAAPAIGVCAWLIFASGIVVRAECIAFDSRRDLALLQIVASQSPGPFPFVPEAIAEPKVRTSLICVGHPGSEDLEIGRPGVKTGYDVLNVSKGLFLGYADQDLQDNSEIGALKHNCWTYWGHSGAPLIERRIGKLVGLHSSWDETTCMRRGVPLAAIKDFLQEHTSFIID
ncbi:MAG: hypothetical protein Q9227_001294 [Pyrenula ochraceoflavens]